MALERGIKIDMGMSESGEPQREVVETKGRGGGSDGPWLIDVEYFMPELKIGINGRKFEVLALPEEGRLRGVIFDLDRCLYGGEDGETYLRVGLEKEIEAIAKRLGLDFSDAYQRVGEKRHDISVREGRKSTLTEAVKELGLDTEWWNEVRNDCYKPENFLRPDPELVVAIGRVADHYRVAVASNSPSGLLGRVLRQLGFSNSIIEKVSIFGPNDLGVAKPDPAYYWRVAEQLGLSPKECFSVGDRVEADGIPALRGGMGAVIVSGPDGVKQLVNDYLMQQGEVLARDFDIAAYLKQTYEPGEVKVVGLTGRAGAGKTTRANDFMKVGEELGIPVVVLGLDVFFRLSSGGRRAWLEEEGISEEERLRRENQDSWWDFDRAGGALDTLKDGDRLLMTGVYNRRDKGELTGTVEIMPDKEKGLVVVFEGVGIGHLRDKMDDLIFIAAHPNERMERLLGRDMSRRVGDAAKNRFRITQLYEAAHFAKMGSKVTRVLENTSGSLREAPPIAPFV